MDNPLRKLGDYGQSPWLDFISRDLVRSGELARMIEQDGLKGVTSNPSIFEQAIGRSEDYAERVRELRAADLPPEGIYEQLAVEDIRLACDALAPVYQATAGDDGFASIEVSPLLARDAEATVAEARRLWAAVDRPNLMVKVPGTEEGVPAVRRLIEEGISVNVTLLFSRDAYLRVLDAYVSALQARQAARLPLDRVSSVASFFVSRIDTAVDRRLAELAPRAQGAARSRIEALQGKAAIANAKIAYGVCRDLLASARWRPLQEMGARPQRLLWASTGTKNPAYSDVLYVEELIGPGTVSTLPPATMAAFRDHGRLRLSLLEDPSEAERVMGDLGALGLQFEEITSRLLEEGIASFAKAHRDLVAAIAARP